MEAQLIIRQANEKDIIELVRLNEIVHQLHISFNVGIFKETRNEDVVNWFAGSLGAKDLIILVAEVESRVAGYMMVKKNDLPENIFLNARRTLYIEQVAVDQTYRGQGVFRSLMQKVIGISEELGYKKIQLDVWTNNDNAKKVFEHFGFVTYNEKMELCR